MLYDARPRIRYCPANDFWACQGHGVVGTGPEPAKAYERWWNEAKRPYKAVVATPVGRVHVAGSRMAVGSHIDFVRRNQGR